MLFCRFISSNNYRLAKNSNMLQLLSVGVCKSKVARNKGVLPSFFLSFTQSLAYTIHTRLHKFTLIFCKIHNCLFLWIATLGIRKARNGNNFHKFSFLWIATPCFSKACNDGKFLSKIQNHSDFCQKIHNFHAFFKFSPSLC